MQSWSIIIFGFNEEKTVKAVIESASKLLKCISNDQGELIVVDDGSTDNSINEINLALNDFPGLKVIEHQKNKGIGAALLSGYSSASAENICAIPADGQFDLFQLKENATVESNTIISFYRHKNDIYSPFRKFLSACNRFLLRFFMGVNVRDINWVKVYKRDNLKALNLVLGSSLVESEICIKLIKNGIRLVELPTIYSPRKFGTPKGASVKIILTALAELPKLFIETVLFKPTK